MGKCINYDKVELEFLKSEFYKPKFNQCRNEYKKILSNKCKIAYKKEIVHTLLQVERGYLLSKLPKNIIWQECSFTVKEILDFNVINELSWSNVFGSKRKIKEIIPLINDGVCDNEHIPKIKSIIPKLTKRQNSKLIVLRKGDEIGFSILEGNHRAIAYCMKHLKENNLNKRFIIIVGYLPTFKSCIWY